MISAVVIRCSDKNKMSDFHLSSLMPKCILLCYNGLEQYRFGIRIKYPRDECLLAFCKPLWKSVFCSQYLHNGKIYQISQLYIFEAWYDICTILGAYLLIQVHQVWIIKWKTSGEHFKEDYSAWPNICSCSLVPLVCKKLLTRLWSISTWDEIDYRYVFLIVKGILLLHSCFLGLFGFLLLLWNKNLIAKMT